MFGLSVFLKDRLIARSTFKNDEVRIGRSADNDVQLENLGVSRYHAAIENKDGFPVLKDLGGKGGTWVNGERLAGRRGLHDGDRIAIGKFLLLVQRAKEKASSAEVRDPAAYARAGATAVSKLSSEARERSCPIIAHLEVPERESDPPRIFNLERDVILVGSAPGNDIVIDGKGVAPRACAIVRGWTGFSVVAIAPGVRLNHSPVDGRALLASRDEIFLGSARMRFLAVRREGAP